MEVLFRLIFKVDYQPIVAVVIGKEFVRFGRVLISQNIRRPRVKAVVDEEANLHAHAFFIVVEFVPAVGNRVRVEFKHRHLVSFFCL